MSEADDRALRPLVVVAMPVGRKPDPTSSIEIDFDDVYERAVRPALDDLGVEVLRAGDERSGVFLDVPALERLLLAEVVVADLTLLSPSVFYELGVRHAARPRTTVTTVAEISRLPFDAAPLRAIPYELEDGTLPESEATKLRSAVATAVASALQASVADSPLVQLIDDFPGVRLPHDSTESFRDRVRKVASVHVRLAELSRATDRAAAVAEVRRIEEALDAPHPETELLVDVLLTYRDLEAYDEMIRCVGDLPPTIRESITIQEQLGFALNRSGDREAAIRVLSAVIDRHGPSPETNGVLGRVYKDLYRDAADAGDTAAAAVHLDEAIATYRAGFEADPRDHYPGVNAVTLLLQKETPEALQEAQELATIVAFAVSRRGGLASNDYWDLVTVLELAAVRLDDATAARAAAKAAQADAKDWMYDTTLGNLALISRRYGDEAEPWLSEIRERLEAARRRAPSE